MRESERVTLVRELKSYYDYNLGEMVQGKVLKKTVPCQISNLSVEFKNQYFDKSDLDAKKIRFNSGELDNFNYILIKDKKYVAINYNNTFMRRRNVIYVREVLSNDKD
ncbi:hypothetical protein HZY83_07385 [Gemella sp. GH3]|uniref:hypothetical protein n=1 Tax=unclassified Gemella TaxID=2624949 RepID=UPI0015CFCB91|nr:MULTISPECIES: hypothetical protein [unclassified Gemella]MBF0714496.1 hypothetical protein [Gemella sp. GH3.1]NYS51448.1 hypothetical protein [Gemella sp. GH3]